MKHVMALSFILLSMNGFSASKPKTYSCAFSNQKDEMITITTNSDIYGEVSEEFFTVASPGIFPEFKGFDRDLALCAYQGIYENESLKTGMTCRGVSLGSGYDYTTSFVISSDDDITKNPKAFSAVIKNGQKVYRLSCQ